LGDPAAWAGRRGRTDWRFPGDGPDSADGPAAAGGAARLRTE